MSDKLKEEIYKAQKKRAQKLAKLLTHRGDWKDSSIPRSLIHGLSTFNITKNKKRIAELKKAWAQGK